MQTQKLGKTLVLTHPNRLGDSVLSLPLHRALSQHGSIETNIGPAYRFLFEVSGTSVTFTEPLYPKGAHALIREAKRIEREAYQTAFLIRPNFRSALLAYLARIPVRVGDSTEGRAPLLTHRAKVAPRANQLDRLRAFGAPVGVEVPPDFGLPAAPRLNPPTIGIVPATSYEDKFIPGAALRDVCERLIAAGYPLVLLGGPNEGQWAGPVRGLPAEDWIGKFSLPDLIRPLSSLSAVLAADGGLYHFSVACGVPSVGVYGPTAKRYWWHHWGPHVPVLAPEGKMENVTADMLWDALTQVLENSQSST